MLVFYINVACLLVCCIYEKNSVSALVIGNLANLMLLILEIKTAYSQGRKYWKSLFNQFDVLTNLLSIVIYGLQSEGVDNTGIVVTVGISLTIVFIRGILYLRVFSNTRFLIAMIIRVFKDMGPFLIILFAFILSGTFLD